jgi:sporulation protein YlmC with PRC-barrel domain
MDGQGIDVVSRWRGLPVIGTDGVKVGQITEIYLDDRDDQPRWALVGDSPGQGSLCPIGAAVERDGAVHVPYDSARVTAAPGMAPAGGLSEEEEADLHYHYGLDYRPRPIELDEEPSTAAAAVSRNGSGP